MKKSLRAVVIAGMSVPILLLTGVTPAQAATFDLVGGRERVKVVIPANALLGHCNVHVDNQFVGGLEVQANNPVAGVYRAAPGNRSILLVCAPPGGIFQSYGPKLVAVAPADPVPDFVDQVLVGVGLGALASDPTLR